MPRYAYRAKRGPKEIVEGVLEAENPERAVSRLTEQGFVPIRVAPAPHEVIRLPIPVTRGVRVKSHEVTLFTRQLAGLFKSNIPVLQALELIRTKAERPALRQVVGQIVDFIREGRPLSEAFERFPSLFPPLYCSLIRAGEVGGQMDEMLAHLTDYRENQEALKAKVQLATVYPFFLLAVGVATIVVLLVVVMPHLSSLFEGLQQNLPWPTRLVIAVSHFLTRTWWIWGALTAGGWALLTRSVGPGRFLLDRLQLTLPIWRELTRKVEAARFCRTLGLLLENGVSILQAVAAAVPTVENQKIRASLTQIEGALAAGTTLSRCLEHVPVFTPFIRGVIAIGEESGDLSRHLVDISQSLESEVEKTLQTMTTLLEPILILILGAIIGIIVAAMLLPVFEIGSGMHLE